jgi:hypothetical protein
VILERHALDDRVGPDHDNRFHLPASNDFCKFNQITSLVPNAFESALASDSFNLTSANARAVMRRMDKPLFSAITLRDQPRSHISSKTNVPGE